MLRGFKGSLGTPIECNHYVRKAVHILIGGTTKEINHRAVFTFNLLLLNLFLLKVYQNIMFHDLFHTKILSLR